MPTKKILRKKFLRIDVTPSVTNACVATGQAGFYISILLFNEKLPDGRKGGCSEMFPALLQLFIIRGSG